jgi:E3 ubiquitin-protein ligase UBR3
MMSGRVHDILASVLFHATYPRNLSNSKEPQGLLFTALHLLALRFGCLCSSSKQGGSEQPCHRDI